LNHRGTENTELFIVSCAAGATNNNTFSLRPLCLCG